MNATKSKGLQKCEIKKGSQIFGFSVIFVLIHLAVNKKGCLKSDSP